MGASVPEFDDLLARYAEAALARAPDRLAALYAADVRVFDAWAVWSYEGRDAWRRNLEDWLGSLGDERVRVTFDEVRASRQGSLGHLSAIVTYAALDKTGKVLRALQERLSWILTDAGTGWVIVHQHTSAPINPDDQKAMLWKG